MQAFAKTQITATNIFKCPVVVRISYYHLLVLKMFQFFLAYENTPAETGDS